MGLFGFLKTVGKKVSPGREAEEIKSDIHEALGSHVEDLYVGFSEGTVTLRGTADSVAVRDKAVLLAGNVQGVESVTDNLRVKAQDTVPEPKFYTVEKGDSLSKIARAHYGDANKWQQLFEANREVIKDPDLIYPGQQIRVPDLSARS